MAQAVIGLDIGGTKISGIVWLNKTVVRSLQVPTPKNKHGFKKTIIRLVDLLSTGRNIGAVGVGIAGVVDGKSGKVKICPNINYLERENIRGYMPFAKNKVFVDNDANCFSLAESLLGKGKAYRNFMGITLGTGIGGGIVIDRKLYRGSHGSAGEVGHMMADLKNDSEYYFQKARDKKDFERMGKVLGVLFANIINTLDVEAMVLGGGVALSHGKQFLPEAMRVCKLHMVNKTEMPKVIFSSLKHAGAIGAALLVFEK